MRDPEILVSRGSVEAFARNLLRPGACILDQGQTSHWLEKSFQAPAAVILEHAWYDFLTIFCYEHTEMLWVSVAEIRVKGRVWYYGQQTRGAFAQQAIQ